MLACLTVRSSGIAASVRLKITDPIAAWEIDNAVTVRLRDYDMDIAEANARLIAYEVSKLFGDGSGGDNEERELV